MSRLRFLTAGESHGPALSAILEGIPAGLCISEEAINQDLARRQGGFGRGKRMGLESDRIRILSGVRGGITLGSPISILIENHGGVSNDADWIVSLMKEVNSKYFGVLPDWREPGSQFDNVGFLEKTLPYAGGMSFRNQPTDALTEKMIKLTYDAGFRGWYGIESSGRENIRKSKELLLKHLPM